MTQRLHFDHISRSRKWPVPTPRSVDRSDAARPQIPSSAAGASEPDSEHPRGVPEYPASLRRHD